MPLLPKDCLALARIPPRRIHAFRTELVRIPLHDPPPERREALPDDVDHELRRDEARDQQDALVGGCGLGEREDVCERDVADVDLKRGCEVEWFWQRMGVEREGTYEVIEWEMHGLDLLVFPVQEIIDSEAVSLIHVLGSLDRLQHWPNDDIRVNNSKVKDGLLFRHEIPRSLLGQLLRYVVS
jgi:hypothetical protein